MTLPNAQSSFCSSRSRMVEEPLHGTTGHYDIYVLIEWNQPFPNRAVDAFVEAVFQNDPRWQQFMDSLPNPRIQLIRQRGFSTDADGYTVFVNVVHETNPLLYEFRLDNYEELFDLDMPGLLTGALAYRQYLRDDPLYVVCTNGAHDPCCARHGIPVYKALSLYLGKPCVWQTSHIGGHRFAGTMIAFPQAVYYGRVFQDDVPAIVDATEADQLVLPHYRGRGCYDKVAQAGEYFLRRETGNVEFGAFRLIEREALADERWLLRYETLDAAQATHEIVVSRRLSDWAIPKSCANEEAESAQIFRLERYST